ncbi:hypothetical protein K435DRAFT_799195 [Dendrothele bispora CBS 962.96]|uniref:Uncharacterized protein n=1 Tax=Dendrothele bispora (strain CBS 962.96) TaxID=1314807 RepID=A0A4S8LX50_DENBC|nr:hypothetical protein K435DRAFT_799195 [Dendrothele bispora CBS 962.96]
MSQDWKWDLGCPRTGNGTWDVPRLEMGLGMSHDWKWDLGCPTTGNGTWDVPRLEMGLGMSHDWKWDLGCPKILVLEVGHPQLLPVNEDGTSQQNINLGCPTLGHPRILNQLGYPKLKKWDVPDLSHCWDVPLQKKWDIPDLSHCWDVPLFLKWDIPGLSHHWDVPP